MIYKFIPLTKGQKAMVDDFDYDRLMAIGRWCYSKSGYAVHYTTDANGKRKTIFMHRVVMAAALKRSGSHLQVDHINQCRIDNRRANLRLATRAQNQAHKRKRVDSSSPYKGVTLNKGMWEARIKCGAQRFNLGRYDSPGIAAWVYDAASLLLYDQFAGRNFTEYPSRQTFELVIAILNQYGLNTRPLRTSDAFYRSR